MERLKNEQNGSLPSSTEDLTLSSPSTTTTTTTPTTAVKDIVATPSPTENKSPGINEDTYTITDDTDPSAPASNATDEDNGSNIRKRSGANTATTNGKAEPLATSATGTTTKTTTTARSSSSSGKGADDSKKEKSSDVINTVPPPDGGWGWIVVLSSFLIHVIADGVVYTFGIFLIEFVEVFDVGRGPASWIGALQPAVTFTVGPLASALTNRYGCRAVTIFGAIIAGIGFVISVPAPNLYYLYVTCGVMTGLGFGLIYLPAIVSVAQYFEKKRSFATGLAVCGSGFGTFVLAPITEILVQEYSWRGAMLILGGIIFNVVVCGLLFRPLEAPADCETDKTSESGALSSSSNEEEKEALQTNSEGTTKTSPSIMTEMIPMITQTTTTTTKKNGRETPEMTFLIKKHHGGEGGGEWEGSKKSSMEVIPLSKGSANGGSHQNMNNHQQKSAPVGGGGNAGAVLANSDTDVLISSIVTDHGEAHGPDDGLSTPSDLLLNSFQVHVDFPSEMDDNLRELSASQCLTVPGTRNNKQDPASLARSDGAIHRYRTKSESANKRDGGHKSASPTHIGRRSRGGSQSSSSSNPHMLAPLSRKDIFYSGSLLNIPMYRSQPDVYLATVTPMSPSHRDKDAGGDGGEDGKSTNKCFEFSREFRDTMREMMSFSLLKNPVFLMFGISNFLTSIGFNMPFIFLPDRAKIAGIDEKNAAFLLSIIGIANTCGRIIFGFLSDRSWVNRLSLYNSALTICGLATAFSVIMGDSYMAFVIYAAIFGIFIGVYVSLTSVVLVDLLGLEYLTNSFGLLLLFQGAATFVGPPIAGLLYDWTGSYDISFIVMGTLIAISGAMLFLLPCMQRHYNRQVPVVEIIRDVEMGKQIQEDSEIAEIIHSREILPTVNRSGGEQS